MKRCIIIVSALLCILTVSGCSGSHSTAGDNDSVEDGNINITTASAKITVKDGCEVDEWKELTDGAVAFSQWIEGFETEPAESVPEDGRSYTIELTFGRNAPVTHTYLNCGERGCYLDSEDGWLAVKNPSPMPRGFVREFGIYVWDIFKVEHTDCAGTTELELSDKEKMTLSEWLGGLKYKRRWFHEGETPGDCDGGEVYAFTFADSELSYVDNGENERYLHFGGEWYSISDCAEFPIEL